MYNDFYTPTVTTTSSSNWLIVSAVLALIGGIVAYVLFINKKNNGEFKGFLEWLHDFLNFKKYFVEIILKVSYVIMLIYVTLGSFSLIGQDVTSFFVCIIFGNIGVRLVYELLMMTVTLVNNTTEINKKLKKDNK